MKLLLMISPFLSMSAAYNDLDDNYLQKVIEDKEAFRKHLECFVDVNPCDVFSSQAKAHITESLADSCEECDEAQKHLVHAFVTTMKTDFPEIYEAFENKYDPDRTLISKLDEKMKKYWR